jgi:hypothetical protein
VSLEEREWASQPHVLAGLKINLRHQVLGIEIQDKEYRHSKSTVSDPDDEKVLLSDKELKRISDEIVTVKGETKRRVTNNALRESKERIEPVLFIYLGAFVVKDSRSEKDKSYKLASGLGVPSVVYGISFPTSENLSRVTPAHAKWIEQDWEDIEYFVNEVTGFTEEELFDEEEEEVLND